MSRLKNYFPLSPVIVLLLCICFIISGCGQAEPNIEKIIQSGAEVAAGPDETGLQQSIAPPPAPYSPTSAGEVNTSNEFAVNYMGLGQVTYYISEIEITSTAPEWAENEPDAAAYLLMDIDILNIDVPPDEEMARNGYINCFQLYSAEAPEPYGVSYPWLYSPCYFNAARDPDDLKGYFLFTLPEPGGSRSVTLCWVLDEIGVQLLKSDKVSLTCTFAENIIMPLNYDTITNSTSQS